MQLIIENQNSKAAHVTKNKHSSDRMYIIYMGVSMVVHSFLDCVDVFMSRQGDS